MISWFLSVSSHVADEFMIQRSIWIGDNDFLTVKINIAEMINAIHYQVAVTRIVKLGLEIL